LIRVLQTETTEMVRRGTKSEAVPRRGARLLVPLRPISPSPPSNPLVPQLMTLA
jgi:hypothetical protein